MNMENGRWPRGMDGICAKADSEDLSHSLQYLALFSSVLTLLMSSQIVCLPGCLPNQAEDDSLSCLSTQVGPACDMVPGI